ncbi:MAG: DNA mismatch repair endonuclease MutL [Elusimicrobia bacterium]|jgi:DNA mismatch repair protein MutL|nr:DNA mismatch repair endonuclease MutL [Elusimicrobiota bacterium]
MTIKVMPKEVIERIAAGEVVQRPASVIKELVENSIDAGATRIDITFTDGGINYMEVSDNGSGIPKGEIPVALKRHATSKITSADDLNKIRTMGFRGEALPSVAAVSRLTVITSPQNGDGAGDAYRYTVKGGTSGDIEPAARGEGTTVKVEELFFNVPARKKFLKTVNTEKRHIIKTVKSLALSRTDIAFSLNEERNNIFKYTASNLKERFVAINGKKLWDKLIKVDFENPFLKVSGYMTKPELFYSNKNKINFMVNDRPVYSPLIFHALMQGYRSYIPPNKYPSSVLNLEIKPAAVDVNVHPAKKEVRFVNQQGIHKIISTVMKNILQNTSAVLEIEVPEKNTNFNLKSSKARRGFFKGRKGRPAELTSFRNIDPVEATKFTISSFDEGSSKSRRIGEAARPAGRIIPRFQLLKKYIVGEDLNGLLLIDQHTAWERINFEKLQKQYSDDTINSQRDMFPEVMELEPGETELLKENTGLLKRFGIEIENFGPGTFKIVATPVIAGRDKGGKETIGMIEEIIDLLDKSSVVPDSRDLSDKIIETIACRKSIKAGDSMDEKEINNMIKQLMRCRIPHRCPHGRPVIVRISEDELDKRFDRK